MKRRLWRAVNYNGWLGLLLGRSILAAFTIIVGRVLLRAPLVEYVDAILDVTLVRWRNREEIVQGNSIHPTC